MGRRISIYRPNAKVRGVARRLRSLDRWADSFEGFTPPVNDQFYNFKIPVLDRLVNPPTTTAEIQAAAINCLLKAAMHLTCSPLAKETEYYRVAVLLTWPDLFYSEVTVFYDKVYYNRFWHDTADTDRLELPSKKFALNIPERFEQRGTLVGEEYEIDQGEVLIHHYQQWTIGEPI